MKLLKLAMIAAAVASGSTPALAVEPITNPAGSFEIPLPTIQTPAGGSSTEYQMQSHGRPIPVPRCPPNVSCPY